MDWEKERWRKLYLRESLDQQCWPVLVRAFRDFLVRVAKDDGTLLAQTDNPGEDLAAALKAERHEVETICVAVELFLRDGYLSHKRKRLWVSNLEQAQERFSAKSDAQRAREYRERKRAKTREPERDERHDAQSDASHGNDQTDPNERAEESARDAQRDAAPPAQLELTPPEPPSKRKKRSTTLGGETPQQICWRVWRELFAKEYGGAAYVEDGADGKAMKDIASAAEAHAKQHPDYRPQEHETTRERIEQIARHWMWGYLENPGHGGYLVQERHPLRCLDRDLHKFGLPWGPRPVRPRGADADEQRSARNKRALAESVRRLREQAAERGENIETEDFGT